jgi:transcriptional regulator
MSIVYSEIVDIDKQIFQLTLRKKGLIPKVIRQMLDEGHSQCKVSAILGISKKDVNDCAKGLEMELRKRGAQPKELRGAVKP